MGGDIILPWPPASLRGKVNNHNWSDGEIETLRRVYEAAEYRGDIRLDELAQQMGRSRSAISRKATSLGLSDAKRPGRCKPQVSKRKYTNAEDRAAALSERMRRQHAERPHPMAGKTHTPEARDKISAKSRAAWAAAPQSRRDEQGLRLLQSKIKKFGSTVGPRSGTSWKAGWREIGGKRNYYRSRWEANYARYLEWLKARGEIADWQHEPETFWFEAIKRGVRSYLPDFRVWENDGSSYLHEVKGWMDARSKTTLKRMAKYHPRETIIVIRERAYNDIARKIGPMIVGWESADRRGRW